MRRVLPGGATLSGGDARLIAVRPGTAVVERTRPRPANPPKSGAGHAVEDNFPVGRQHQKLQEQVNRDGPGASRPAPSWLSDKIEKVILPVVIAVLTALILAWLGLNK